ncbi:hypothetical protein CEE35_02845 [Candidatus Aerophobetes bacterium Ae_b3b]|nr:MAG: hypothetical protein CEE35_02845 [Candidatus Aerophobetes bacterium Ae_b3b]
MKNVILLTVDTLRKDTLGCYGNEDKLTPFIDSLQDKCIRFTKAQSIGPYTQASFPGILTSSYYLEYGRGKKLSPKRTLISEVLQKTKITTAAFHSNPYLCDFFGWNRGWDIFYDSMEADVTPEVPYVKGDGINKEVSEWLSSRVKEKEYKPFFLWLHYMDVHEPYIPEKKYVDMVDPSVNLTQDEMFTLFKNVLLKRDASDKGTVKLLKKLYDAHVREVDDYIKDFFGILERFNLLKNSLVIMTSDHGDEFNEHGGLSHDGKMYSELIDIPFLIYDYDTAKAEVCHALVSNIDIPPTIVHLFALEPVNDFEGHSLLPLEDYPKKGCFGESISKIGHKEKETDKPIYFYQEDEQKIIYRQDSNIWEMYGLKEDPKELNNIIGTSVMAREMKEKLRPRIKKMG